MSIPVEDVFELREQLKTVPGDWMITTVTPLPTAPNYPLLAIVEGGDIGSGKTRVMTILFFKLGNWYTRFIDIGLVGTENIITSNVRVVAWKLLTDPLPGFGLRGDYYNTIDFTGNIVASRYETIDVDWNGQPVITGVGISNFSIKWSGFLSIPTTGNYNLKLVTNRGVRLLVDDVPYIDHPNNIADTSFVTGTLFLVQGFVSLKIEYSQPQATGKIHLLLAEPISNTNIFNTIPITRLYLPSYISQ